MDGKFFTTAANYLDNLELFPYFNICHYLLISIQVRELAPGNKTFSRQHPLSNYVATMLLCFAGSLLSNFLIGEPLIIPFKYHENILHASICWYLVNYFPFDLFYTILKFLPIYISVSLAKELYRCKMINIGVGVASKRFNDSVLVWAMIGLAKGCGEDILLPLAEACMGRISTSNVLLINPSFNFKGSLAVTLMFALEKFQKVPLASSQLFLAALMFLTYFRVSSLIVGIKDPFIPFENIICGLFFGGLVDSIKRMSINSTTNTNGNINFSTASKCTNMSNNVSNNMEDDEDGEEVEDDDDEGCDDESKEMDGFEKDVKFMNKKGDNKSDCTKNSKCTGCGDCKYDKVINNASTNIRSASSSDSTAHGSTNKKRK